MATPPIVPPKGGTRNQWKDWPTASAGRTGAVTGAAEPETSANLDRAISTFGKGIAEAAAQGMEAMNSNLSYESLVEGFMTTGESATTHMLGYDSIKIWEYGQKDATEKVIPAGKALITTQRLLLLSCQPTYSAGVAKTGEPHLGSSSGNYQLSYEAANSVLYQPIPLTCFRSLSLSMASGSHGQAVVHKDRAAINKGICCGCCKQLGSWTGSASNKTMHDRFIQLAFEGAFVQGFEGAWGQNQKMALQINVPATTPMEEMQAWASALQAAPPKIMNPPDVAEQDLPVQRMSRDQKAAPIAQQVAAPASAGAMSTLIGGLRGMRP